jgi:hypothetical protein
MPSGQISRAMFVPWSWGATVTRTRKNAYQTTWSLAGSRLDVCACFSHSEGKRCRSTSSMLSFEMPCLRRLSGLSGSTFVLLAHLLVHLRELPYFFKKTDSILIDSRAVCSTDDCTGSQLTLIQYLSTRKFQTAMGFVWRLPGQNKGFPCITGLIIRRNTTPHVQFQRRL